MRDWGSNIANAHFITVAAHEVEVRAKAALVCARVKKRVEVEALEYIIVVDIKVEAAKVVVLLDSILGMKLM